MPADPCPLRPLPDSLAPLATLLDAEIRPPDFVIRPFFPRGEVTEIVGAHGVFKSTLALDACLSVATGRPWGGVPVEKGRSAFITLEDSMFTLARRVKAWLDGVHQHAEILMGGMEEAAAEREARENFSFLTREDAQGVVLTRTDGNGLTRALPEVADRVAALVQGASLVVIETVSRIHDGPETNEGYRALVVSLEHISLATGAAVVIVRHASKKAAREAIIDSYAGRGGAALSDAVRSSLVVTRAAGLVTLTAAKTTHAEEGQVITWRPVIVPHLQCPRLEPMTGAESALADVDLLCAWMETCERGIVRSSFKKGGLPPGLTRERTERALDASVAAGRVVEIEEPRGRNKQKTTVYYLGHRLDDVTLAKHRRAA
jgi:hypothetical protein